MPDKKLSEILSVPIIHCEFNKEVVMFFADGTSLHSEYAEGQYGDGGTWWDDQKVYWKDNRGKTYGVEVDTVMPKKEKR